MANIIHPNGIYGIQFNASNGDRRTISLGKKTTKKQAEAVTPKIEALVASAITGASGRRGL
jgi:hypothetical protein